MAKVRADNPGLSDADLMIKVSDRVKQAEDARKNRAEVQAQAFPYHMVNNQLQHVAPPAMPALRRQGPAAPQYVPVYPYAVAPVPVPVAFQPFQPFQPFENHHHALPPPPFQQQYMEAAPPPPPPPPQPYVQFLHFPHYYFDQHYHPERLPNLHHRF